MELLSFWLSLTASSGVARPKKVSIFKMWARKSGSIQKSWGIINFFAHTLEAREKLLGLKISKFRFYTIEIDTF